MLNNIKSKISHYHQNIRSWKSKRKIVVIESDDWGSIRMPDKKTYNHLLSNGIRVDHCPFNKYDSLASEDDLNALFEVLVKFRDFKGNHPAITANCVIANPDFEKIRNNNFKEYYYELFTETLKKYPNHQNSFNYWKQGIGEKIFFPQFHGREHLNVNRWMKALSLRLPETMLAFDSDLFGISKMITSEQRKSYLEAFAADSYDHEDQINSIIMEGLALFQKILGYRSKSLIAPNYVWSDSNELSSFKQGVKFIQGQKKQITHDFISNRTKTINHYSGNSNELGQIYTVRNCMFEPSIYSNKNNIASCLSQIRNAFAWGTPAIITSHRVNFMGSLDLKNRTENLQKFFELLSEILKRWPDVEFMTSDALGDLILKDKTVAVSKRSF